MGGCMKKNPIPKRKKAPTVAAVGALKNAQTSTRVNYSGKSTATEAQRQRVIDALRRRPHTSYDLRRLGIYQAPARIKELRDRFGYGIATDFVTLVDRDGYRHARCALYTLVSEPDGQSPQ